MLFLSGRHINSGHHGNHVKVLCRPQRLASCYCYPCRAEIGPGFHDTFVIGDLPAKEAREFLDKCLQQDGDPEVSNTDWKDVHKVGH